MKKNLKEWTAGGKPVVNNSQRDNWKGYWGLEESQKGEGVLTKGGGRKTRARESKRKD